jgi:tape measure domain-containing protein
VSGTIDNRIVGLEFDNSKFEKNVSTTIDSLDGLSNSLKLDGISEGIKNISSATDAMKMPLNAIADGIASVSSRISAMGAIGFAVIQNLVDGFTKLAGATLNAITGPLIEGGKQRALNIAKAKFQFKGLGMDVDATMKSALAAVEGTAYGLDEAAIAAAMFGASGMRAGAEMTAALRGISGVAALSSSSYADIADVFTKVSGQGRLMGDDLNRLASRGVNAAATLGKALGKSESDIRKMVSKGEIDFKLFAKIMDDTFGEHATKASETFTGALANVKAALARIGAQFFTYQFEAMRIVFNELRPVINSVAKALEPLIDLVGKRMERGAEAVAKFLKGLNMKPLIDNFATFEEKLEKFLDAWGLTVKLTFSFIFKGLRNITNALVTIIKPIGEAFKAIFPPATSKEILSIAIRFMMLTKKLQPTPALIEHLTTAFKGIFAIISLTGKTIKFLYQAFMEIVDILLVATGVTRSLTSGIGDASNSIFNFFIELNESADKGEYFSKALKKMKGYLENIAVPIAWVVDGLKKMVGGLESAFNWFGNLVVGFKPMEDGMTTFGKIALFMSNVFDAMGTAVNALIKFLSPLTEALANMLGSTAFSLDNILKVFLALFAGTTFASGANFFTTLSDAVKGFVPNFVAVFEAAQGALSGFTNNLNARALKEIAVAVLILAGAMFVISIIDPDRLTASMLAVTLLIGQLMVTMSVFSNMGTITGITKAAVALTILSFGLILLAVAVGMLSRLDPEALGKGLISVGVILAQFAIFSNYVSLEKGMVKTGVALILLSVSLLILSKAISAIGSIETETIVKAMITIGVFLGLVTGMSRLVKPEEAIALATTMLVLSIALVIFAKALTMIGGLSLEEIGKGLIGMGGALILVIGAMHLIPDDAAAGAASLLIVAVALTILAKALQLLGAMSWEELATGLVAIGVSLLLIGVFLAVMADPKMLIGAAALVIVSGALIAIAMVLKILGSMSVESIAIALGTIAAVFLILGIAGYALVGALPGLLGLAAALLLIGIAIFAAGAGVMMFSTGLALLIATLGTGSVVLISFILLLAQSLPVLGRALGLTFGAFVAGLVEAQKDIAAGLVMLFTVVLEALIAVIPLFQEFTRILFDGLIDLFITYIPVIVDSLLLLLTSIMQSIEEYLPQIIESAGNIAVAFIDGMAEYYDKIITAGTNFIIKLMQGIAKNAVKIGDEGFKTVIAFIDGVTNSINKNGPQLRRAADDLIAAIFNQGKLLLGGRYSFGKLAGNIIDGLKQGLLDGIDKVVGAISDVIGAAFRAAKAAGWIKSPSRLFSKIGVWIVQGFANGLIATKKTAVAAATTVVEATYSAMKAANDAADNLLVNISDPVIRPVIDLDGVRKGVDSISSLMNSTSALKVAGDVNGRLSQDNSNIAAAATDASGSKTEINLTQNNYSPEALSRLEIYRQTRNQIHQLKGLGV